MIKYSFIARRLGLLHPRRETLFARTLSLITIAIAVGCNSAGRSPPAAPKSSSEAQQGPIVVETPRLGMATSPTTPSVWILNLAEKTSIPILSDLRKVQWADNGLTLLAWSNRMNELITQEGMVLEVLGVDPGLSCSDEFTYSSAQTSTVALFRPSTGEVTRLDVSSQRYLPTYRLPRSAPLNPGACDSWSWAVDLQRQRIAYTRDDEAASTIWIAQFDTATPWRLFHLEDQNSKLSPIAWSPGGQFLIVEERRRTEPGSTYLVLDEQGAVVFQTKSLLVWAGPSRLLAMDGPSNTGLGFPGERCDATSPSGACFHTVQDGETLLSVLSQVHLSQDDIGDVALVDARGGPELGISAALSDPLPVGTVLRLPVPVVGHLVDLILAQQLGVGFDLRYLECISPDARIWVIAQPRNLGRMDPSGPYLKSYDHLVIDMPTGEQLLSVRTSSIESCSWTPDLTKVVLSVWNKDQTSMR